MHCRTFGSIHGFYLLDPRNTPFLMCDNQKVYNRDHMAHRMKNIYYLALGRRSLSTTALYQSLLPFFLSSKSSVPSYCILVSHATLFSPIFIINPSTRINFPQSQLYPPANLYFPSFIETKLTNKNCIYLSYTM